MACKYKSKLCVSGWCDVACMYCTFTQERNCEHNKKTNADIIRSMSDEELDYFLRKVTYGMDECPYEYGSEKALEWLRKPAE